MRYSLLIPALAAALTAGAEVTTVEEFDYYGPYPMSAPLMIDSVDVHSKKYDVKGLLAQPIELGATKASGVRHQGVAVPGYENGPALHMIAFTAENNSYVEQTLSVSGLHDYKVLVDGKEMSGQLKLKPASHRVVIKYLSQPGQADSAKVKFEGKGVLKITNDGRRLYTMDDVLDGTRISGLSISPDGRYMINVYTTTSKGGQGASIWRLSEVATGKTILSTTERITWMPTSTRYYVTRKTVDGWGLVAVDPATGVEETLTEKLPQGSFRVMPDEKRLLIYSTQEGPKEDPEIYQILEPDDRQPGWRNRLSLSIFDLASNVLTPLTHNYRGLGMLDISDDGQHLLLSVRDRRLEKRPTSLTTILSLDLQTMKADTIVARDGFINSAIYSPDGTEILISGSPEALGGIGNVVPEGKIPSMIDVQLYLRRADGRIEPLTREFNPNVTSVTWSRADGQVYFTAENRDYVSLYRLNPKNGKIAQIPGTEEFVRGFSLPRTGNTMVWYGQSASNPNRLYSMDTRKLKSTLLDEPQGKMMEEVKLGACETWTFINSRGDSIWGRYYLPPNFDPTVKYPMIVNYYGGCSPTSRYFESRYPHHAYAALDYVVLVLQPSGATGFGQEFSSRHVKTAGQGPAEDIIEGTRRFCQEHEYVDTTKIGCIGASYGGFMTQYLQTVTPMFAAAISHAGISDHTSYWGEGYWGYSYSEVSMGDAYPWSDTDLYVKQSPLYRADKIHTPLLFLHGDVDKNVPPGESIQLFTALKLLGRETAFVEVTGQDHHILDYSKYLKWQSTIFAWFAKYLKNDPTWWNALYPPKTL